MKKMGKEWLSPLRISRINSKLFFPAQDVVSLDLGIREPDSFIGEFVPTLKSIYCFGGSTTFGHGVSYTASWPKQLNFDNFISYNCGSVKSDLKANLHVLVELLRLGHRPDIVIFYDGVNENSGYTMWDPSIPHYVDYDTQFFAMREILTAFRVLKFRLYAFIYSVAGKRFLRFISYVIKEKTLHNHSLLFTFYSKIKKYFNKPSPDFDPDGKFVNSAALSYTNTKNLIELILDGFGVEKSFYFLQPTLWDLSREKFSSKHRYLKNLYDEITRLNPDVINISDTCGILLDEEMFFDWNHLDEKGNRIVAKVIENFITDYFTYKKS